MRINVSIAFCSRRCLKGYKYLNKCPSIGVHERKQANKYKKGMRNLKTIKTKRNEKKNNDKNTIRERMRKNVKITNEFMNERKKILM